MKGTTEYLPPEVYDYDEAAAVGPIDYSTAGDMWWVGGWVGWVRHKIDLNAFSIICLDGVPGLQI